MTEAKKDKMQEYINTQISKGTINVLNGKRVYSFQPFGGEFPSLRSINKVLDFIRANIHDADLMRLFRPYKDENGTYIKSYIYGREGVIKHYYNLTC